MGTDNDSRHVEHIRQHGKQNTDTHSPAYGIDRYAWNQGYKALYDFQIFENEEPCLISRGGQRYVVRDAVETLSKRNRSVVCNGS